MKRDKRPEKIEQSSILFVEGKDEALFFESLLKHLSITGVQPLDIGGKDKFSTGFRTFLNTDGASTVTKIGVVRDAEKNQAPSAFESICSTLRKNNYPCPSSLSEPFSESDNKRVGIFIMPDHEHEGMLEDLCLKSIRGTPGECCLDSYMDCIKKTLAESEKDKFNPSKAKVQSYLASRTPIVNALGLAAQKKFWNFDHSCFDQIKAFLVKMNR